jgi:hypothetical protein
MQAHIAFKVWLVALVALVLPPTAWGSELTPTLADGELGVVVSEVSLPPSMTKDLVSGLTNRVVMRVWLLKSRETVAQVLVGVAVKYDLWEETFAVNVTVDDALASSSTLHGVDEVVSMLSNLRVPRLFPANAALSAAQLQMRAELLFDPIEKSRMEEIRKWVAENDRAAAPDAATLSSMLPVPRSASSRLFERIFEQYARGASLAATWKQTLVSKPFKMDDLRRGP